MFMPETATYLHEAERRSSVIRPFVPKDMQFPLSLEGMPGLQPWNRERSTAVSELTRSDLTIVTCKIKQIFAVLVLSKVKQNHPRSTAVAIVAKVSREMFTPAILFSDAEGKGDRFAAKTQPL